MTWIFWISLGCFLAALAIVAGAFGSHALKKIRSSGDLQLFDMAVRYHMLHAIGVIIVGLIATRIESYWLTASAITFVLGIALFSGSLYVKVLKGKMFWPLATPIGGSLLILGWLLIQGALFG